MQASGSSQRCMPWPNEKLRTSKLKKWMILWWPKCFEPMKSNSTNDTTDSWIEFIKNTANEIRDLSLVQGNVMLPLLGCLPSPYFSFSTLSTSSRPVHSMNYLMLPSLSDPLITVWSLGLTPASCTITNPYLSPIISLLIMPHCFLITINHLLPNSLLTRLLIPLCLTFPSCIVD